MVERPEDSGPTSVESTNTLRNQEAEPSMEVNMDDIPSLAPDSATAIVPEEDEMLMGDPTSVAGEMAKLQVSSPNSPKPEDRET